MDGKLETPQEALLLPHSHPTLGLRRKIFPAVLYTDILKAYNAAVSFYCFLPRERGQNHSASKLSALRKNRLSSFPFRFDSFALFFP